LYGHHVSTDDERSTYLVYLVTNRHVFEGDNTAVVRFNPAGTDPAREVELALVDSDGERLWLAHEDAEIDIAVMPIDANKLEQQGIQFSFFRSHQHVLARPAAVEKGISEGDGVYILGFPMGLVGGERSYVIVRQGALARIRDWLAETSKDFLIDVSAFPGNSGGPVVSRPETTAIQGTKRQTAAFLMGVVKGYVPYRDSAVSMQTGRTRVIFEENSGLASVVPMDYVIEVIADHLASLGPPPPTEEPSVPPEEAPASDIPKKGRCEALVGKNGRRRKNRQANRGRRGQPDRADRARAGCRASSLTLSNRRIRVSGSGGPRYVLAADR
jgi:S1-C subfamily serine protease